MSRAQFSKEMGITRGRVSQLLKKGLPIGPDGRIPMDAARAWYSANVHITGQKRGPKQPLDSKLPAAERLLEAQARKEEQLAELRAMEVLARKNELLEASGVRKGWSKIILAARSRLLQIPGKLAPKLLGKTNAVDVQEILRAEIYSALTALSEGEGLES